MKRVLLLSIASLFAAPSFADGFYLEGGAVYMQQQEERAPSTVLVATPHLYSDGSTRYDLEYRSFRNDRLYDINNVRNPAGSFALGYDWRWRIIAIDLQLQHQSFFAVGDHGQNTVRLNLRWYPFG